MKPHPLFGLLLATVAVATAQSITPFQVQTPSYRLHMFNHGNHAVNVAGLWMPGNISLTMRGPDGQFVQYKSKDTPVFAVFGVFGDVIYDASYVCNSSHTVGYAPTSP